MFFRRPIFGFMHVAQMNHWKAVWQNQTEKLRLTRLLDLTSKIYIGVLGSEALPLFSLMKDKSEILFQNANLGLFEYPTLQHLQVIAGQYDCWVWYIHTKGVSFTDPTHLPGRENWRNAMEFVVLEHWPQCLEALAQHDMAGPLFGHFDGPSSPPFFAGNFWWATSDYIRRLPPIHTLDQTNRYPAERWIAQAHPIAKGFLEGKFMDVVQKKLVFSDQGNPDQEL